MSRGIFTEEELEQLHRFHPAHRYLAERIEDVTNNADFAEGMLVTLLSIVRDKQERDMVTFNELMKKLEAG